MVASIKLGGNLYGALAYNQEKIDAGQGRILDTNRVFVPENGEFRVADCMHDFERAMPSHINSKRFVVHVSLNPHPDDKLSDEQMATLGREYLQRMGLGGQPYLMFKHEDIDREHFHIVTTRVRGDGTLIDDRNNYKRSKQITDDLEKEFGLHPKDKRQGEAWQLAPVSATEGNLKKQVANVIKPLNSLYRFGSLGEYRALLSLYNIGVEEMRGVNKGGEYKGLVYSVLDENGQRVGKPLKASLFGKGVGFDALEQQYEKSKETIKADGCPARTRALVSASLANSRTGSEFRADLQEKGIDLVLRRNAEGRLFGATFIDHNDRTVLNGSALGKEFSANKLAERFADFSRGEDLQPSTPAAPVQQADLGKPSAPALPGKAVQDAPTQPDHGGDPSGGILSVLTPEPGNSGDGQASPAPRKKRKRRYGRQQ